MSRRSRKRKQSLKKISENILKNSINDDIEVENHSEKKSKADRVLDRIKGKNPFISQDFNDAISSKTVICSTIKFRDTFKCGEVLSCIIGGYTIEVNILTVDNNCNTMSLIEISYVTITNSIGYYIETPIIKNKSELSLIEPLDESAINCYNIERKVDLGFKLIGSKYIAFADFEFTCGKNITTRMSEIISAGFVVTDEYYNIIDTYYNTCKPATNYKLSEVCRELTGLKQAEIDKSFSSNTVFKDVLNMLTKYNVNTVMVYGNADRVCLESDKIHHRKNYMSYDNIVLVTNMIHDIQDEIDNMLGLKDAIKLSELAVSLKFDADGKQFHNALTDALALMHVYKMACTGEFRKCEQFYELNNARINSKKAKQAEILASKVESAFKIPPCKDEIIFYNNALLENDKSELNWFIDMRKEVVKWFKKHARFRKCVVHVDESNNLLWISNLACRKAIPDKYYGVEVQEFVLQKDELDITSILNNKGKIKV